MTLLYVVLCAIGDDAAFPIAIFPDVMRADQFAARLRHKITQAQDSRNMRFAIEEAPFVDVESLTEIALAELLPRRAIALQGRLEIE